MSKLLRQVQPAAWEEAEGQGSLRLYLARGCEDSAKWLGFDGVPAAITGDDPFSSVTSISDQPLTHSVVT